MSKEMLEIEIGEQTYKLGFPTRDDAVRAEDKGLVITQLETKPIKVSEKLFYTSLLAKQPSITEEEAKKLLEQYIEEGGAIGEINDFLIGQYVGLQQSQDGKKKKKVKIVKV